LGHCKAESVGNCPLQHHSWCPLALRTIYIPPMLQINNSRCRKKSAVGALYKISDSTSLSPLVLVALPSTTTSKTSPRLLTGHSWKSVILGVRDPGSETCGEVGGFLGLICEYSSTTALRRYRCNRWTTNERRISPPSALLVSILLRGRSYFQYSKATSTDNTGITHLQRRKDSSSKSNSGSEFPLLLLSGCR
jgi:hypothetical protein